MNMNMNNINTNNMSMNNQQKEILDSFKMGWDNVVEATKTAVETTREVVEKEQTRIQASLFANGPYVRGMYYYVRVCTVYEYE